LLHTPNHWVGAPKQLKAALRVVAEGVAAFWSLCASRGIEVLNIQTERETWYPRTASEWRSEDGFLEVISRGLPEGLPDPAAEKIRLYLDVFGIPRTLAGAMALHPPPGPVKEATFRVPLLEQALCLGEWLQLSAVREELKLRDLEVVQFTTKAKDSPTTELRYEDGKVNGVVAMEHLGASEIVHEVLRDLPQGMFQKLRVDHENPLSPEVRAVHQHLCSSDVDWAQR